MKKIIALLLVVFCSTVQARMVDVERTITGFGDTYQNALNAALLEAVQQVRGLEVGTEKNLHMTLHQIATDRSETTIATMGVKQDIYTQSRGWIKNYEVLEATQADEKHGTWAVTAKVIVPRFETNVVPNDKRYTIAVMPFRIGKKAFSYNETTIPAAEASMRLQEAIQGKLTQSRRFAVVNRDFGEEFRSEINLLKSDNVSLVETSRLGEVAGADFMVVGRLYQIGKSPKADKTFYGAKMNAGMVRLEAAFQVIEVPTQRVAWSDVVRVDTKPDSDFELSDIYQMGAETIVSNLLSVIYPVRILDVVSGDQIYLTQGGSLIIKGHRYGVHGDSRSLKDPDTGINVMIEGPVVAEVEITDVFPKYSVAKLVSGDVSDFSSMSTLRMRNATEAPKPPRRETQGSSEAPIQWK